MTKLSHHQNAIGEYRPISMKFDGLTGGYIKEHTPVGQTVYAMGRFRIAPFYGPSFINREKTLVIMYANGVTNTMGRLHVFLRSGSRTDSVSNNRLCFNSRSNADVITVSLISKKEVTDNAWHSFLISWNATTAEFVFKIDGEDADDLTQPSRVAPVANTMSLVSSSLLYIGQASQGYGADITNNWSGEFSVFAAGSGYLTNWDDFFFPNNLPKRLDHVGWTEFGNGVYSPPMSLLDGASQWYSTLYTSAGNAFTAVMGFTALPLNGASRRLLRVANPGGFSTASIEIYAADHVTYPGKLYFHSANSVNTILLQRASAVSFDDGLPHILFYSFNATTGEFTIAIDGQVPTLTPVVGPITGTFGTGAGSGFGIGALVGGTQYHNRHIFYCGFKEAYLTNWQDFMTHDGKMREIDEGDWHQWRGRPLLWQKAGKMEESSGSLGPMTKNGAVTYVPGSQPLVYHPYCDMENNLGVIGNMRRSGKCYPIVSGVPIRGTKDAPQNSGGVLLHFSPPRQVISPIPWDRSYFQQIADGAVVSTFPSGSSVDANGYFYKDTVWEWMLIVTLLPAKASAVRMHRLDFRFEDIAPPGTNPGLVLGTNYLNTSNFWRTILYWTGSAWSFQTGDYAAGVWTARATASVLSAVDYPVHGSITVLDAGDDIVAFLQIYEVDVPTDDTAVALNYYVANRPLKDYTGVAIQNHEDPGTYMRYRNLMVMDM